MGLGVLALMLAGCGGSPVPSRDQDMYALSQANVGCTADPGTVCADVKLYATPINGFGTEFRPGWTENPADGKTRVVDHLYRDLQSDGRWQLSLGFVGGLKPGIYELSVRYSNNYKDCPVSPGLAPDQIRLLDANGFVNLWRGALRSNGIVFQVLDEV